jgi:hypothetical protein
MTLANARFWHERGLGECPLSAGYEGEADISRSLAIGRDL